MDVRKICVVIRRMELQGFSLHLLNGSRLDPDVGLELGALICSDGREHPHASTFQTLPDFYQPASICLGLNRLQPTAVLGRSLYRGVFNLTTLLQRSDLCEDAGGCIACAVKRTQ